MPGKSALKQAFCSIDVEIVDEEKSKVNIKCMLTQEQMQQMLQQNQKKRAVFIALDKSSSMKKYEAIVKESSKRLA